VESSAPLIESPTDIAAESHPMKRVLEIAAFDLTTVVTIP
jgi:hypothetical protein